MAPMSVYDPARFESLEAYAAQLNAQLAGKSAREVVAWALATFGTRAVLSSSFGIQSAVMLHLVSSASSSEVRTPVVFVDTGYLPKETYQFATHLESSLGLDVRVYQSPMSPARMEALYGKLYEVETPEAHAKYGFLRKVEPMQRALRELDAAALLVGVRAQQTATRKAMQVVNVQDGRLKICPILNWTKQDVDAYMTQHDLPYHPLYAEGYVSVGDWHSSRPVTAADGDDERAGRFHGVSQECGLHVDLQVTEADLALPSDPLYLSDNERKLQAKASAPGTRVLFTKPTCKYCLAAKEELRSRGWAFDEVSVGADLSVSALQRIVGRPVKTVPQIYLDGQYVGGYTELVAHLGVPSKFAAQ